MDTVGFEQDASADYVLRRADTETVADYVKRKNRETARLRHSRPGWRLSTHRVELEAGLWVELPGDWVEGTGPMVAGDWYTDADGNFHIRDTS